MKHAEAHRLPSGDFAFCVVVTVRLDSPTEPEVTEDGSEVPSFTHYVRTLLVIAPSIDSAASHARAWLEDHPPEEDEYPPGVLDRIELSVVDPFAISHDVLDPDAGASLGVQYTSGIAMFNAQQFSEDVEDLPETFARLLITPVDTNDEPETEDDGLEPDGPSIVAIVKPPGREKQSDGA